MKYNDLMDKIYVVGQHHYGLFNLWKTVRQDDLTEEEFKHLDKMVKVLSNDIGKFQQKFDNYIEKKIRKHKVPK